jgi:hypothetical protein
MRKSHDKWRREEKRFKELNPIVGSKCENCCDNCIMFEHPDDGHMSCSILLSTHAIEFHRAVNSLKHNYDEIEGYGYGEPMHLSWMEFLAMIRIQQQFTAVYGCNLFEKKDRSYIYPV